MEVVDLEELEVLVDLEVQVKVTDKIEQMVLLELQDLEVLVVHQELTPATMLDKVVLVELEELVVPEVPEVMVATGVQLEVQVQLDPVEPQVQQETQVLTETLLMDLEVQVDLEVHQVLEVPVEELHLLT